MPIGGNASRLLHVLTEPGIPRYNCIDVGIHYSVSTPARPAHFALSHRGGRRRRTLEQFVPVLLADEAPREHVVPISGYERRQTLAAHETLEVEHVERRARRRGIVAAAAAAHHELAGGNGLAARRAGSRAAEQPHIVLFAQDHASFGETRRANVGQHGATTRTL